MNDIRCTIKKPIAVLSENERGYTKEVNLVSWNDNAPKLDIRQWHPGHERCGKGISLTEEETYILYLALREIYSDKEGVVAFGEN